MLPFFLVNETTKLKKLLFHCYEWYNVKNKRREMMICNILQDNTLLICLARL